MTFQEFKDIYQKVPVVEHLNTVCKEPLVSVCVQTYQHADYIRECLDGILMQKTDFPYEILLGEDASTDGTREICLEYANKYPDRIRLFLHDRGNKIEILGKATGRFNFLYNVFNAHGRYIALCEGDDIWTDVFKLQKQVDFLEANSLYVMTYGNALIDDRTEVYRKDKYYLESHNPKTITGTKVFGLGVPTLTMLFRNYKVFLPEFILALSGDQFLRLFLAEKGWFYYHGDTFGVHRKHSGGISRTTDMLEWNRNTVFYLYKYLEGGALIEHNHIRAKIVEYEIYTFFLAFRRKEFSLMFTLISRIIFDRYFYTRRNIGLYKLLLIEVLMKGKFDKLDIF
jgi:glycosyltransferase involved in cell wall biosynthesis